MTHQQILDKLGAKHLIKSIDDDLARLTFEAMCYAKHNTIDNELSFILPKMLFRWNCVLNAGKDISETYKNKTVLTLAILLHKYGFTDKDITKEALKAIDCLNKAVALSDDFFRKSNEIKSFLNSDAVPLKRKPAIPESLTFYREQDVISIQLEGKFYAAYIDMISGQNESPIIEFYDGVFDHVPTLKELEKLKAKGEVYNDGIERSSSYSIDGMKYLPDPANQIQLISACVAEKPLNTHLGNPVGGEEFIDLFTLQDRIKEMFNKR